MGDQQGRLKIIEVTNVDFSLMQFLLPLMRAMRARGHEVIGVCAEGPFLAGPRAEGFRIESLKLERSVSPLAHWQAFRALVRLFRAEQPDLVHAHMPISGFLARMAAWWAGVPRIAYTGHGFWFNFPGSWPRAAVGFAMEWLAARVTDTFLTVSEAEAHDAKRLHIHRDAVAIGNGRDPARFRSDFTVRQRFRARLGVPDEAVVVLAVSRLVWHKGYPELAAAMRAVPGAMLWVAGERLDLRSRSRHGRAVARCRSRRTAAPAGLSRRRARPDGGGRYLRAAQPVRGTADVGDRGHADRPSGCRHERARPGGAGGAGSDGAAGATG